MLPKFCGAVNKKTNLVYLKKRIHKACFLTTFLTTCGDFWLIFDYFLIVLSLDESIFYLGIILGLLSFAFIGLYLVVLKDQSMMLAFSVSLCTGIALLIAILLSSITGTVIPIIFKKLKIDTAVASGPLITTINDLVAVVTYYGLAWILLINVMGL